MLSRLISFATDDSGNKLAGAAVAVKRWDGSDVAIYADRAGQSQIPGSVITTAANGAFQFYAASGWYKLTVTKPGYAPTVLEDVPLSPVEEKWTPEYFGISEGDDYADITTGLRAWHDAIIEHAGGAVATGRVREGRIVLPPGRYETDSLLWHPAVSFAQTSRSGSVLRLKANATPIGPDAVRALFYVLARCVDTSANTAWAPLFEDGRLSGNKSGQNGQVAYGIYCEPATNDPAYPGDTTGYTSIHARNIEIENCSGDGIQSRSGRQRMMLYGRWRVTGCGVMQPDGVTVAIRSNGVEYLGNDPVIVDGGSGNHTGHSLLMTGGSGLVCQGNNLFAPRPEARDDSAVALALSNVNGATVTGNVLNDTCSVVYSASDNSQMRGVVIVGNDCRPNAGIFSADGVLRGTASDELNCFFRVKRAKNVSIGPNAYNATTQGYRYENVAVFVDGAQASIHLMAPTMETPVPVKPWHTSNPVPLSISPDSSVSYQWVDPYRALHRFNGALAVGVAHNTEVDAGYALVVGTDPALFKQEAVLQRGSALVWGQSVFNESPTEGAESVSWPAERQELYLNNLSPINSYTQALPADPVAGKDYVISSRAGIAALTLTPAAGHSLTSPSTHFVPPGGSISLRFKPGDSNWWVKTHAEAPVVVNVGAGNTTLQRVHHRREVVVQNALASSVFLPATAFAGWMVGVTRRSTSTANVLLKAQAGAAIDNPNSGSDYGLLAGDSVEVVCVSNADGASAVFIVR